MVKLFSQFSEIVYEQLLNILHTVLSQETHDIFLNKFLKIAYDGQQGRRVMAWVFLLDFLLLEA